MIDPIARRDFLRTGITVVGGLYLPSNAVADLNPAGPIHIVNNYDQAIEVRLYHSDKLADVFATWPIVEAKKTSVLNDGNQKPFIVGADWGIQIEFRNRFKSPMQRILNVGSPNDKGEWIVDAEMVIKSDDQYRDDFRIQKIAGYDIDDKFTKTETKLLENALALFYRRFLQPHWRVLPELVTKAGVKTSENFPTKDFDEPRLGPRDYIAWQLGWMASSLGTDPGPKDLFPRVKLNHANDASEDWLARAALDKVRVRDWKAPSRYEGSFEMEINSAKLLNNRLATHYSSPEFWAGVIAHEALHNLGHSHPPSREDAGYYQYQMILIEYMVMNNGKIRYGEKNKTPVHCGGRPR